MNRALLQLQLAVSFALWIYIIYRAVFISITQDEAHSYLLVKTVNWKQALGTANTHWLNSLFMRLFLWWPGPDSVWKLRMLSILSWPLYAYSTIKFSQLFQNRWIGIVFFGAAVLNPFLIFYFSLGRGYAAACSFILLGLLLTARLILAREFQPTKWLPVFNFAAVAVLANFTSFYFFLALTAFFLCVLVFKQNIGFALTRQGRGWLVMVLCICAWATSMLFFIRKNGDLYVGGEDSLVDSLFGSLLSSAVQRDKFDVLYQSQGVAYLLSEKLPVEFHLAGSIVFFVLVIAFLYSVYIFLIKKKLTSASIGVFIVSIMVLLSAVLHRTFQTPYLFARTALVLLPPLITGLFFVADEVSCRYWKIKIPVSLALALLLLALGYNFFKCISPHAFREWPVQTNTQHSLDLIEASGSKSVGLDEWHYAVFVNYYLLAYPNRYHFSAERLSRASSADHLSRFDHLVLSPGHYDNTLLKKWRIRKKFPCSGTIVLEK